MLIFLVGLVIHMILWWLEFFPREVGLVLIGFGLGEVLGYFRTFPRNFKLLVG